MSFAATLAASKEEKKKNAARQNEVPGTYGDDSDDEDIGRCQCADCLALDAKMEAL
jgi:hypothetical protein